MNQVYSKPAKPGFHISFFVSRFSGETIYQVCDDVGLIYDTIFEDRLAKWLA